MTVEENDNGLDRHFKEELYSYEVDPPPVVWASVKERLPKRSTDNSHSFTLESLLEWFRPGYRLYPSLTVVGLLLISLFIWLSVRNTNTIHGTAQIEGENLCHGTAYLFHVHDNQKPLDSVMFHQKMSLDTTGRFAFTKVPSGAYLLRIHVHHDSPKFPNYKFGYYGDKLHWDHATLIHSDSPEKDYAVNIPKLTP